MKVEPLGGSRVGCIGIIVGVFGIGVLRGLYIIRGNASLGNTGELVRPTGVLVPVEGGFPVFWVGSEVIGCETPGGGFGERALGKVAGKHSSGISTQIVGFGEGVLGGLVGEHSCGIKTQIVGFKGGDMEGIPGAKVGSSESSKFGIFVEPSGVALELGLAVAFVGSGEIVGKPVDVFED